MKTMDKNIAMMCIKKLQVSLLLIIVLLVSGSSSAQNTDPVFTQYMNSMQTVNPAYVGMWDKVGMQLFTRRYYVGQAAAPLVKSLILYSPLKNKDFGLGFSLTDERFGSEKRLTIAFDYAYEVQIDWQSYLRFGLKTGFVNYDNLLTKCDLDPGVDIPDEMFQSDVHLDLMFNCGVGALFYSRDYYIGLSIPRILESDFDANFNNYSYLAEIRYAYLMGGILYGRQRQIRFKPTIMVKAGLQEKIQVDLSANVMFYDKFWIGAMYRTNNTAAIITQIELNKNISLGYAMELPFGKEIFKYQLGTHEFRISYEYDLYKRLYVKKQYF